MNRLTEMLTEYKLLKNKNQLTVHNLFDINMLAILSEDFNDYMEEIMMKMTQFIKSTKPIQKE